MLRVQWDVPFTSSTENNKIVLFNTKKREKGLGGGGGGNQTQNCTHWLERGPGVAAIFFFLPISKKCLNVLIVIALNIDSPGRDPFSLSDNFYYPISSTQLVFIN
jgi:hypothetical protein